MRHFIAVLGQVHKQAVTGIRLHVSEIDIHDVGHIVGGNQHGLFVGVGCLRRGFDDQVDIQEFLDGLNLQRVSLDGLVRVFVAHDAQGNGRLGQIGAGRLGIGDGYHGHEHHGCQQQSKNGPLLHFVFLLKHVVLFQRASPPGYWVNLSRTRS